MKSSRGMNDAARRVDRVEVPLWGDSASISSGRVRPFMWLDRLLIWVIALAGVIATAFLLAVPRFFLPMEDVTILFQFSRNLARTGAITYVPFGPRAEGATDFAWMVVLSLGIKLGIDPFWLTAAVNGVSLVLIAMLLIRIAGQRPRIGPVLFIMGAFALMPQIFAAASGFSTLPFACLLLCLALCFLSDMGWGTPLVALALCLFRPDGVVFAIPLLVAALIIYPQRWRHLSVDIVAFVVPGLCYFLWRWHYFGEMLPLPFLVKADAQRFAHVIVGTSVSQGMFFCLFAGTMLWFALRNHPQDSRNRAILLCFVVLPNLFYFSMRLDQNIAQRFFIYLPVGVAVLLARNWGELRTKSGFLLRLGCAAWLLFLSVPYILDAEAFRRDQLGNRKAIAQAMATLPHGTVLLTEAGIIPYYSGWIAYDAWGLNTPRFTKHLLQPSDITDLRPDLIVTLPELSQEKRGVTCSGDSTWQTPYITRTWEHLTRNLVTGADPSRYELWLLPLGSSSYRTAHHLRQGEGDQECWFVRKDSSLHGPLDAVLALHGGMTPERSHDTFSQATGKHL